ncbi:MAG TPA: RNA polymerase sigma factor [Solirubrobacteraceae bacterium]|jgi:RNA polymerase sigma-70 factor (ECF subfamily)
MTLTSADIAQLFDSFAEELLAFYVRRTLLPDVSVELLAETFASAFVAREQCRASDLQGQRAWLYGIAHNQLADYFRRGRVERQALERLGVDPRGLTDAEYDRIEDELSSQQVHELLNAELESLPVEQQDALRLRVIEELPYDEVARSLGVSEQAARARVSRGLRALRRSQAAVNLREATDHV